MTESEFEELEIAVHQMFAWLQQGNNKDEFSISQEEVKAKIIEINTLLYKRDYDGLEAKVRELASSHDKRIQVINKLNKIKDLTEEAYNLLQEYTKEFRMTKEMKQIEDRLTKIVILWDDE